MRADREIENGASKRESCDRFCIKARAWAGSRPQVSGAAERGHLCGVRLRLRFCFPVLSLPKFSKCLIFKFVVR